MTDVLRKLGARRAGKTPLICANREGIKKHFLPLLAGGYEELQGEGDHLGSIHTLEGGHRGWGLWERLFAGGREAPPAWPAQHRGRSVPATPGTARRNAGALWSRPFEWALQKLLVFFFFFLILDKNGEEAWKVLESEFLFLSPFPLGRKARN